MIAIIGGTTYSIKTNTFQSEDTIEMRATCSFSIDDKQNEYSFHKGQPVRIEDDKNNNELVFAGYLETSDKYPLASRQANVYMHDIVCIDMHYLADKRRISYAARNKLAGDIIKDIVDQKLIEEGVYYSKDLNFVETTTADFSTGELSNVIAENDSVKLDKVGSDVTDIDNDNASFSEGTPTDVVAINDSLQLANDYALSFDGVDDYVNLNNVILPSGVKTIEIKLKLPPVGAGSGVDYDYFILTDEGDSYIFYYNDGQTLRFIPKGASGGSSLDYTIDIDDDQYHNLAYVNDGNTQKFIIDGVEVASNTSPIALSGQTNDFLGGYNDSNNRNWYGEIAKLNVWNSARNLSEIQSDFENELIGNETGLVAYYKMNEGIGTTLTDYAGTNDGTIYGATWNTTSYYKWNGTRQSPQLDLSAVNDVASSSISWTYYPYQTNFNITNLTDEWNIERGFPSLSTTSEDGNKSVYFPGDGTYHRIKSKYRYKVSEGEEYKCRIRVKGDTGTSRMYVGLDGEGYDYFSTTNGINVEDAWATYEGTLTISADISEVGIWIFNYQDNTGAFWVDDITITKTSVVNSVDDSLLTTIETSVDGGSTWQTATNGGAIPNLPADPTTLDVRQTLSTTDTTVTPVLSSIEVSIESAYETTGYRISEPFDLSPAVENGGSTISWQETTPPSTSITVETSTDDGATWDTATNGQPIPNLPNDLMYQNLRYKTTLETNDKSVTPTFDEINIDIASGGTTIEDGEEILETRANFVPTEQLISSVADKVNYWWKIDSNKMIHFKSRESEPANWELEPEYIRGMPTTKVGNPLYRNQQLVKGPVGITEEQVDIERGDGEKRAFPLSFNVAEEPTIEISINGGAWQSQTVGRKGVDDDFQWYWEKESDVVSQDRSETRLTSNDRVRVTFIGQFKIVAQTYDPNLIAQQKNIDGTSGIVEDAITVGNVEGREAAIEIGNSKIEKYGVTSKQLKFQTMRSGLKAGQLITVRNLDAMDIADGEKLLITKTSTFDESGQIFYDISAVKGPKHRTWEEFFVELTKRAELVISEGIGESEILIIPIDFSKTWTQAENPNIFRKLKADGTWLADGTYTPNFEDNDRVTHIAWFNGNTELGRQEYTQQDVNTADRVNTLTYLGPNSANDDITHFGWIGGFRATEEVGTGVLIDKVAYDLIKEETEALQISRSDFSWNY